MRSFVLPLIVNLCWLLFVTTFTGMVIGEEVSRPQTVDFARDIYPILRKNCFSCHGEEVQESGLRLDLRSRAFLGGDQGKLFVSGQPQESRLIQVVSGVDPEIGIMPPTGEGKPLSPAQVALLTRWINEGGTWPEEITGKLAGSNHWAFKPILAGEQPQVALPHWPRNPIDKYILARLEMAGVAPSSEASRGMLLKRLYLDLIGILPPVDLVRRFALDRRPDAYERLIDETLASPHFGERWGRHWLDLARYADSDGYEKDRPRPFAWRYRHWVINALNHDQPFHEFSIDQIAGDMKVGATIDQQVASGFHRNTLHNTEGGTDQEEDRVKKTIDRTNTVGTIWLGLTIGCAQCHTHKYDPLTQREYFSMYAFFNSLDEQNVSAPLEWEVAEYEKQQSRFELEHEPFVAAIDHYRLNELARAQMEWEQTASVSTTVWDSLKPVVVQSKMSATLTLQEDNSVLVSGRNENSDVYTVELLPGQRKINAIRLEVLPHESLPQQGPGRAQNGNFVLTTLNAKVVSLADNSTARPIHFEQSHADYSQAKWDVSQAINGNSSDGWAIAAQQGSRHVAVFELEETILLKEKERLIISLEQIYDQGDPHNIGCFRLSLTESELPADLDGLPVAVAQALDVPVVDRSPGQNKSIARYYESLDLQLSHLRRAADEHMAKAPKPAGTMGQAVVQRETLRETRVHVRGDFLQKGDVVAVNTPNVLPPITPKETDPNRLAFAEWLFTAENPLTARVAVNRIWQRYFERGIVSTSDDFGVQGETPTHPVLLDVLAWNFRQDGWSVKRLHRAIISSATYRQTSASRPDLLDVDPENSLLARQHRTRVEAEVIRDLVLTASDMLARQIGGPSVRPPQPSEYTGLTYANSAKWEVSQGGDAQRRGLYTFFQRTSPYPMLVTFDAPDSNTCLAMRSRSNTPLQALTLWNDTVFWDAARSLGRRVLTADLPDSVTKRAQYIFRICLARDPGAAELSAIIQLFEENRALGAADSKQMRLIVGDLPGSDERKLPELMGWIAVARALMNLDEFVTKE